MLQPTRCPPVSGKECGWVLDYAVPFHLHSHMSADTRQHVHEGIQAEFLDASAQQIVEARLSAGGTGAVYVLLTKG